MSCSSSDPPSYCSAASPELKLYQAFIFSVPVFFTFILLLLFYVFYLRRRRTNWQSLRMRASQPNMGNLPRNSEIGLKKEIREMLPVVVFKESFLIRETQCSVCLGEYQSDERLQRIPPCGHTFHVDCIDHWLATNTTCPLCRVSLLPATKAPTTHYEGNMAEQESSEVSTPNAPHGHDGNNIVIHCGTEAAATQRDGPSHGVIVVCQAELTARGEEGSAATAVDGEGQGNNLRSEMSFAGGRIH